MTGLIPKHDWAEIVENLSGREEAGLDSIWVMDHNYQIKLVERIGTEIIQQIG